MKEKALKIKLLIMDVDGVLTDGTILVTSSREDARTFNIYDGMGIVLAQKAGLVVAWVSAGESISVAYRAEKLGVCEIYQGIRDKLSIYNGLLEKYGLKDEEVCYIGDDLIDLKVMKRVGLSVAPANAVSEVKEIASYVSSVSGGCGVARETIEYILKAKGVWEELISRL